MEDPGSEELALAKKGEQHRRLRSYFVDEAGDPTLFNRRKETVVGRDGCSRFFMLGALDIPDPIGLARELEELHTRLRADPWFRAVPSFASSQKKTAIAFHAKDDVPEVRKEVFAVLQRHTMKFYAVIRDKHEVVGHVRRRNAKEPTYRYSANDLYDNLVSRLFRDRLHKGVEFRVTFSRRGSTDRTLALQKSLATARTRFQEKWGKSTDAPILVSAQSSKADYCLQAVDYFLWALQRRFERNESRYLDLLWPKVGLVIDIDSGSDPYGSYYTRERPIPSDRR